jgi:hypothetical protein
MTRPKSVAAGIDALEEQLAVCADLFARTRHTGDFIDERDRMTTLAVLERERNEIGNALRLLRTHAVMAGNFAA